MGDELYEGYTRVSAILDTYQVPQLVKWEKRTDKNDFINALKKAIDHFINESNLPIENLEEFILNKMKNISSSSKFISKTAMAIGTNVDEWIRADISGTKYPKLLSVEAENCVRAWEKFKVDYQIDLSELKAGVRLFNEDTKICGEPDILWEVLSEVIDIKTSSAIRESYWIQTNWYANNLGFKYRSVLRLDKNLGIYEYERRPVSKADSDVFNALVVVYHYFKQFSKGEKE